MIRGACVLLAIAALAGCKRTKMATPEQCQRLLDHFAELKVAENPRAAALSAKDRDELREHVQAEMERDSDVHQVKYECVTEVTAAEYTCAVAAPTADRWSDCIE